MHEVALDGVKKFLDTTLILKNITFLVREGEKVGLIGNNGCGKSTVLKLIAGILELNHCAGYPYAPIPPGFDEGYVKITKDTTVKYLEQIIFEGQDRKVMDVLNSSFQEILEIETKMRLLEYELQVLLEPELSRALRKYSDLMVEYEHKGGYETTEKIGRIIKGLNFSDDFLQQDFQSLSGGEKTTVVLGKLLMDTPDVLLLDEPTNHLDMESVEWLQEYIQNYKGIVIVVSHDRYFLDRVASKIIEIEGGISKTYNGNYSSYLRQKEENQRIQSEQYIEQNKRIKKAEASIEELRSWAAQADNNKFYKRAASIQNKMDRMERLEKPVENKSQMKLKIQQSGRSGNIVIRAESLSKCFGDKEILRQAETLIRYGEKIALIGQNGSGKTTFLKMLLGEESPDRGEVTLGASVELGYLPQNIVFSNEEMTVLDYFRENVSVLEGESREFLAKFLFYGGNVYKKIKLLSGGEKVRLRLSKLLFQQVNLLILDEPTNHLDVASIESIETALTSFKGTIVCISHDRYFINKLCERVIAIEDWKLVSYLGNYDDYKVENRKRTEREHRNLIKQKEPINRNISSRK